MKSEHIVAVELDDPVHARELVALLDQYARDAMGGGKALKPHVRESLVAQLRKVPGYHGALAWRGGEALGLINCFLGFSTFAALPLLNIHDVVVREDCRGQGIGAALLAWAESRARELGCCKLTLEVLSGNRRAMAAYRSAGYVAYELDPAAGQAVLMQKLL